LDFVTFRFQVNTHLFEYQPVRPTNNSVNVLAHDPTGSNSPNNSEHFGPQVAVVFGSFALSGCRKRLAGKTSCEHVEPVFIPGKISRSYVCELFCIWKMVFEYGLTKRVYLAVEKVLPSDPFGGEVKTSDP
jgi:hypothetical protein